MEKKRKVKKHRLKREEEIIAAEKQKFIAEKKGERRGRNKSMIYKVYRILNLKCVFIRGMYLSMFILEIEVLGIFLHK